MLDFNSILRGITLGYSPLLTGEANGDQRTLSPRCQGAKRVMNLALGQLADHDKAVTKIDANGLTSDA